MEQNQHTLPTCVNPFWEVGSAWVDGEQGRTLRRLWDPNDYGETIAADLMVVVSTIQTFLQGQGLQVAGGANALFHGLIDFIIARLENPYATLTWRGGEGRHHLKPRGWTEEDERIWMEWLDTEVLTPENWQRHVMELVFGRRGGRVWEESAGHWRDEWRMYSAYFVIRNRDILQAIDPRSWEETDGAAAGIPTFGEEEWRR